MKLRKLFKNKLAFSLVELVVVIAIMAILAGAVAGAVVGVRASAQNTDATDTASAFQNTYSLLLTGGYDDEVKTATTNTQLATMLNKYLSGMKVVTATSQMTDANFTKYAVLPSKPSNGWFVSDASKAQEYTITIYTENRTVELKYSSSSNVPTSIGKPAAR